ncbi:MAG TPA: DUF1540 domain-containing protein [Noviherbaspirillum sp.]|nr:DUF1540 domain-containing protein [Noviherbaspirillum sp.]
MIPLKRFVRKRCAGRLHRRFFSMERKLVIQLRRVIMKQLSIEMPIVAECAVRECVYNTEQCCHARAITVGNGVHPGCDTFFNGSAHSKAWSRTAGVGACKVSACKFNEDYECMTEQISVGRDGESVRCLTYQR